MWLFLQILGANLSFLWVIGKVLDDHVLKMLSPPYGMLFMEYSWILPVIGIPLVLLAQYIRLQAHKNRRAGLHNKSSRNTVTSSHSIERDNFYSNLQQNQKPLNNDKYYQHDKKLSNLAATVDWSPLSIGGSNFKSSGLHKLSDTLIVMKSSTGGKLFAGIFTFIGGGIPFLMAVITYNRSGFGMELAIPFGVGLLFVLAGGFMFFYPKPRYLDKRRGWFWVGSKNPKNEQVLRQTKIYCPLKDLVALQVVAEQISGKNNHYTSWELNIIKKDGTRYNLLDHGDKASLLQDAETIRDFLSIPILDNTNYLA